MTQLNVSNRDWQETRDHNNSDDSQEEESITSVDQSRSPLVSLASETEPSMLQEDDSNYGTPIRHPRFTNHREKLGNDSTNGMIVRPIPVHATLQQQQQTDHRPADPPEQQERETSSNNIEDDRRSSRPKRELSSDQLNILSSSSYKTTAPATVGATPAKRIRFMSFDEIILTNSKESDDNGSHRPPPPFVLESVEELDLQLGEELKSTDPTSSSRTTTTTTATNTASPRVSPVCVPLLTPPQSPKHQSSIEIVEWPSNLVVESALMSVMAMTDARPLSPASLTGGEREEVDNMETTTATTTGDVTIGDEGCTLTRRLSFITVGSN